MYVLLYIDMGSFGLCRLYYFNWYCIEYMYAGFTDWSTTMKIANVVYFVLLSFFNIFAMLALGERLVRYMNPPSDNEQEMIKQARSIQEDFHASHNLMRKDLIKMFDMYVAKDKRKNSIKRLPFRRTVSAQYIKDD